MATENPREKSGARQPSPAAGGSSAPGTARGGGIETLGRYRLLKKIARGGMAEVYAARSYGAHGFEKTVAIKRILPRYGQDPQFVRMMVDEAKISVLLNHPNIAAVLELGEQDGDYFIVMEFVPGQSVSALVKRMREAGERMAVLEAAFIVVELLQGLHAAHSQRDPNGKPANIIHRDVSPQNVLVSYDGHVKVIDFGIARAKDRLEATEIGTIKGKLRYLAPEMIDPARFAKSGDFDHRVDVFAAGIVLFELVAGRTLFAGSNEVEVYEAITEGAIPDLSSERLCDPALSKIIARALTRRPDDRYPTAEAFADDLRAYVYRSDASFKATRLSTMMQKHFAAEFTAIQNLERTTPEETVTVGYAAGGATDEPKDIVLTRTHTPIHGTASRGAAQPPPESTKQMRSGESGRRKMVPIDGVDAAPPDAATRMAGSPFGELGPSGMVASSTRTARNKRNEEPTQAVENPLIHPISQTQTATDSEGDGPTRTQAMGSSEADALPVSGGHEETPRTRGMARASTGRKPEPARGKSRVIAISAGVGVLLALGIVGIIEVARDDDATTGDAVIGTPGTEVVGTEPVPIVPTQLGTQPQTLPSAGDKIPVLVAVQPADAKVTWIGAGPSQAGPQAQPALFMVDPGSTVELVVGADGYQPRGERVDVRPDQRDQVRVEVALEPMPVAVRLAAKPAAAAVLLDGKPIGADTTVVPGKPVVVEVSAPGYKPFKEERTPELGKPFVVDVELTRQGETKPIVKRESQGEKGVLVVTSAPYWGRVTIDGATLEETTPIRVTLKAGTHEVIVSHPPKGLEKRFKITLKPGETVKRAVTF